MKTRIDVLLLVEHVARELDVACAVAALLRREGVSAHVRNMYLHAPESLARLEPRVVAHPFFYFVEGALATEDYVRRWPSAVHFNLAWEQIHYGAHKKIKAPSDDFTRRRVLHHAWGKFFAGYLEQNGVPPENVFLNGHPAYQLYRAPYSSFFDSREVLAKRHSLDPEARWVFVPENYRWAFIGGKLKTFARLGGDTAEMEGLRDFSIRSLQALMSWCDDVQGGGVELIFRPRPAVHSGKMVAFFREKLGRDKPRFRIIKEGSVREWVMASDLVVSSYSTSLIEAAIAGKDVRMVEPEPLPAGLWCDWYSLAPRCRTREELVATCRGGHAGAPEKLKAWAESEMLAVPDPIAGLAERLRGLAARAPRPVSWLRRLFGAGGTPPKKDYFNAETHEQDAFSVEDSERRISEWARHLSQKKLAATGAGSGTPLVQA